MDHSMMNQGNNPSILGVLFKLEGLYVAKNNNNSPAGVD